MCHLMPARLPLLRVTAPMPEPARSTIMRDADGGHILDAGLYHE